MRALAAALLAAVALTGCGVRLDTPPPEVPVADATEQARQDAARAAADLHGAAQAARATLTGDEALSAVLTAVETTSTEHHAALGGVWEPWPGSGPEATHPAPQTAPAPTAEAVDASPAAVLALLEESAAAAREGALAHGGDLGRLLAAVAISRTYQAADLARALSVPAETLPAAPLPAPEPGTVPADTSRALDAARYALEVVAARSSGGQRAAAVARAEHLSEVAGGVDPEADRRDVAYDITGAEGRSLAAAAELDVVRAYVAALAEEDADREAVLAAATHAAGQARTWDGTLPPLPGLS
ncbi:hypothetical protein [Georgenia sp. H159]|uniref:hypothetical protein n=1 Tax=Georgenia sp. H159 TaxID=3076115 RepID=UPI002D798E4A|nr:hypothetical protein [Georgenia sp. H159]